MANRTNTIKLGIVGCGRVSANHHPPALKNLSSVEIVALGDINTDRLNWVSERFHVKQRYTDYRSLLSNPAIDAVAVGVPVTSKSKTSK